MAGCEVGGLGRGCEEVDSGTEVLRSQGSLTCEGGSGGRTEALGHQQLMVLLTGQGAVHNLVLLHLGFTVVPLKIKAGCCVGTNPQVLGSVNL